MRSKSESRRQAILDVARTVFHELGFDGASMSEISVRVGGSKATLYRYFASKDELFVEVMRQCAENLMPDIFKALDASADLPASLQKFGERFLDASSQPELIGAYRNVFAESGKSSVGRLFYERGPLEGLQQLARYLEECMAQGRLRRASSMVAAQHLFALLRAETVDLLLLGEQERLPAADIPSIAARAVEVFLLGYAPPPAPCVAGQPNV